MRAGFLKGLVMILISSLLMTTAYAYTAVTPTRSGVVGNYLEIQFGSTRIHAKDMYLPNNAGDIVYVHPSDNGFGMRLSWGYQFSEYMALEGGYTYYSPAIYNIQNGNSPELRLQTVDIVGKAIMPLYWGFNIFGKAGPAIAVYKEAGLLSPNPKVGGTDGTNGLTVRPLVAIGFSYAFSPNWIVDLSASRILGGGVVPSSDFIGLGLSYHAVDLYCGQFLC